MSTSGLARHLIREGLLSESDCHLISRDQGTTGATFAKAVVTLGILSEEKLARFLAGKTGLPMFPYDDSCLADSEAVRALPLPLIRSLEVLPVELSNERLTVAMADPLDRDTLQQLRFFAPYKIRPAIATFSTLYEGLEGLICGFTPGRTTLQKLLSLRAPSAACEGVAASGQASSSDPTPVAAAFGAASGGQEDKGRNVATDALSKPLPASTGGAESEDIACQQEAEKMEGAATDFGFENQGGLELSELAEHPEHPDDSFGITGGGVSCRQIGYHLGTGYLNHALAGVSLAADREKAAEAMAQGMIQAGISKGVVFRVDGNNIICLGQWNRDGGNLYGAETEVMPPETSRIPSAEPGSWAAFSAAPEFFASIGDGGLDLLACWEDGGAGKKGLTVAGWEPEAAQQDNLKSLAARLAGRFFKCFA